MWGIYCERSKTVQKSQMELDYASQQPIFALYKPKHQAHIVWRAHWILTGKVGNLHNTPAMKITHVRLI